VNRSGRVAALVVALGLVVCGCSADDGPSGSASRVRELEGQIRTLRSELDAKEATTTSTRPPSDRCFPAGSAYCSTDLNTTTTLPGRLGTAQVLFTELVRTYCDSAPNPLGASYRIDGAAVRVTDIAGNELLVDIEHRQVTPVDGPDGTIPQAYAGCATHVFLGFADH
jgi:hypothetical protein